MPKAFDGTVVPEFLPKMACGGTPRWDYDTECSYRCEDCFAVPGSIGQSQTCKDINTDEYNRQKEWEMLGGQNET